MVDAYLIEEIILDLAERADKASDLSDREDVPEHGQFFYEGKSTGLNLATHVIRAHLAKRMKTGD